ncbi:hypothetical protein CBS101457_005886 [Exobasidium rhododendri]|nr:hypothetical protein CBS101457_005886 [Exobasidium rhododendri]
MRWGIPLFLPTRHFSSARVVSGAKATLPRLTSAAIDRESPAATFLKPHYTTTPIFYVNAAPHIGHLHSAVLADVFSRWSQWRYEGFSEKSPQTTRSDEVKTQAVLATGTDEHGIKIQRAADANHEDPRQLCDRVSERFKDLAKAAGVEYTRFIRTIDQDHVEAVKEVWRRLIESGFIYLGTHKGWYSVSDETFYTSSQIQQRKEKSSEWESIETGSTVEYTEESNYKFKLSQFQQPLLAWLEASPNAVVPASRRQALTEEIKIGLSDLSVSRPRSRLTWGIAVPKDEEHTIYVWLDALINYLTVSGFPWKGEGPEAEMMGCWPSDIQVIGKDIIRFHAVYFPAFLMALNLPLPKHTVVHGHWTMNKHKMSKSRGNVADPFEAIERFGRDELRWFLCRVGGNLSADSDWSDATFLEFHGKYLQGQWGNLVSRILNAKVLESLFDDSKQSQVTLSRPTFQIEDLRLVNLLTHLTEEVSKHMDNFEVNKALETISQALAACNELLQLLEPWRVTSVGFSVSASDVQEAHREKVARAVFLTLETLRLTALNAQAFMPGKMEELLDTLNVAQNNRDPQSAFDMLQSFELIRSSVKVKPLFPRLDAHEGKEKRATPVHHKVRKEKPVKPQSM